MPLVGPRAWAQGLRLPATNSASGVTVTAAPPSTFGSPSIGVSGKPSDKGSKKLEAFGRIFSNLLAGGLILLSLFTLIVLINQGMFSRLVISNNVQSVASFWSDYGKACQLTHHGWVAQSCSQNEVTTTSPTVWAAVGDRLADQWSLELDQGAPLFVSTCVVGGNKAVGWGVLVFVAGYTTYPDCVPLNGPQLIAGIALLETTVRNDQGVYLLTLYSDLNTTMQTVHEYTNSDGTRQGVLPYPLRTVVTTDGSYSYDATGEDFIILSTPLGLRYTVNVYCLSQIQVVSDFGLPGWSQGKHGGVPLSPAWACGNEVDSASELIAIQVLLIVLTVLALNGDVYITFEGIRGLIGGKSVLTYAVLSGLERRKVLTLLIALNAAPSLLYLDVARIYAFSVNGHKIWSLSCLLVATFVSFTLLAGLSLLSALPLPLPAKCVVYSAPIFLYTSIASISLSLSTQANLIYASNQLYAGAPSLSMNFNGVSWPSGSYVPYGVATVVQLFPQEIFYSAFGSLLFSIAFATCRLDWSSRALVLNLEWCASNGFVAHCKVPRVLTSLPLHPSQAIKIGNKMFCRPSTMALLGYASVTEAEKHTFGVVPFDPKPHKDTETYVVSVYWLGCAMLPTSLAWLRPYVAGIVVENHFKVERQSQTQETLDRNRVYRYTRGNCVT